MNYCALNSMCNLDKCFLQQVEIVDMNQYTLGFKNIHFFLNNLTHNLIVLKQSLPLT